MSPHPHREIFVPALYHFGDHDRKRSIHLRVHQMIRSLRFPPGNLQKAVVMLPRHSNIDIVIPWNKTAVPNCPQRVFLRIQNTRCRFSRQERIEIFQYFLHSTSCSFCIFGSYSLYSIFITPVLLETPVYDLMATRVSSSGGSSYSPRTAGAAWHHFPRADFNPDVFKPLPPQRKQLPSF